MWFEELLIAIKSYLVLQLPESLQPVGSALLSCLPILGIFGGLFALVTLIERKMLGRIQNRYGPNRVGPGGLFQPAADGIKMLTKEDIVPKNADHLIHFLAPLGLLVSAMLGLSVIPFGHRLVALDLKRESSSFLRLERRRNWLCSWLDGAVETSMLYLEL
jgi:NADH-quinone oxidoreductase subunit H